MSGYAVDPARPGQASGYQKGRDGDSGRDDTTASGRADMGSMKGPGGGRTGTYDRVSTGQKMVSATWGSLLTSLLVTPLDVVRVRLQSQTPVLRVPNTPPSTLFKELPPNLGVTQCCREVFWVGNNSQFCMAGPSATTNTSGMGASSSGGILASDCLVEETQKRNFTSTLDGLRKIARNEGPLSLWRGLSPTLLMAIPANVIYFTGYDWLRYGRASPIARRVEDKWAPLVAGSVARVTAAAAIGPIEMFRTRLQATSGSGTGTNHFRETLRGLGEMTRSQGYSSLWRGLTLTMWRDVPFSGLYWWGYEAVKHELASARHGHGHHGGGGVDYSRETAVAFVDSFVAGGVSGAASALITTPFDVGKTRQQVFRHSPDSSSSSSSSSSTSASTSTSASASSRSVVRPEQLSIPRFLLHILQEEGVYGLFRGWSARCLKVAPACAIMISTYEVGKSVASQANERRD